MIILFETHDEYQRCPPRVIASAHIIGVRDNDYVYTIIKNRYTGKTEYSEYDPPNLWISKYGGGE